MSKIFKFGEVEVPQERWCWVCIYDDGTELHQFDEKTSTFHQFKEIDQSKLIIFRMIRDDGSTKHDLVFNSAEMKLVHYYTNSVLRDSQFRFRTYVFGFEKNVNGIVVKSLANIMPDDNLTLTDGGINLVIDIPE